MDEHPSKKIPPKANLTTVLGPAEALLGFEPLSSGQEQMEVKAPVAGSTIHFPGKEIDGSLDDPSAAKGKQDVSLTVGPKSFRPFNDRYWIGEQIGTGGMGLVHLGWDLNLQRHVAIKLIRQDRKEDKRNLQRFLREARIASRLRHPGILGIHDFSVDSSGSGYIIMDLITGKTMEQAIPHRPTYQKLLRTQFRAEAQGRGFLSERPEGVFRIRAAESRGGVGTFFRSVS